MSEFMDEAQVAFHLDAGSREDVLRTLADMAEGLGFADSANAVYHAFLDREEEGPTGMQYGFAVPHAKSPVIKRPGVLLAKLQRPVEWPSFDGSPVDVALALLVPEAQAGTTHLRLLSKSAVMLMDEDFRSSLRKCETPRQVSDLINDNLDA